MSDETKEVLMKVRDKIGACLIVEKDIPSVDFNCGIITALRTLEMNTGLEYKEYPTPVG